MDMVASNNTPLAGTAAACESDVEDAATDLAHEILGEYCNGDPWAILSIFFIYHATHETKKVRISVCTP